MDRQRPVDLFRRYLLKGAVGKDAGIVDQDIEAPEGRGRLVDRCHDRRRICAIGTDRQSLAPVALDFGDYRAGFVHPVQICDGHVGPARGKRPGDGCAHATAAACDEGRLADEILHVFLRYLCIDKYRILNDLARAGQSLYVLIGIKRMRYGGARPA